jgi:hypothetical protein
MNKHLPIRREFQRLHWFLDKSYLVHWHGHHQISKGPEHPRQNCDGTLGTLLNGAHSDGISLEISPYKWMK